MPGRRTDTMDIREIIRRLRAGESKRQIAKAMGVNRKTVGQYRRWAREQGLLRGTLLPVEDLQALVEKTLGESAPPRMFRRSNRTGR